MTNTIIKGDCMEVLDKIEGGIDLILTDPPFMISKECKISRTMNPLKHYKYKGKDIDSHFGDWDCQWENEQEYLNWVQIWLKKCFTLLKEGGHLVTFFDRFKVSFLVNYARESGMIPRQCLFWQKTNPVPRARCVNFMEAVEMAIWLTKGTSSRKKSTFNYQLGQHSNVFTHCIVGHTTKKDGERCHPTQKPVAFGEWIISYLTKEEDVVLDPFCGSGTFCLSAINTNRKFIGIEKDEEYYQLANERIRIAQQQLKLCIQGV